LIAIVNTDHFWGVVSRLRFKEWKRSAEVLDLDIPMTSNDVWVGSVDRAATGGCVLTSPDLWVSNQPNLAPSFDPFIASVFPATGFPFRTFLITDETTDAARLARTEFGQFEFIGEESVSVMTLSGTIARRAVGARDVPNVLEGTAYLIRPAIAISHQYNMTAIANFAIEGNGIYNYPTSNFPHLLNDVQGGPDPATCPACNAGVGGFNNLEALLSKRWVDFQYVTGTDPADLTHTPMTTSLVVSFPTKAFHYVHLLAGGGVFPIVTAGYPFGPPFTGTRETIGDELRTALPILALPTQDVGEVVRCWIWDRMEHLLIPPTNPISPGQGNPLCRLPYEVNVIGLQAVDPAPIVFRNNWAIPTSNTTSSQAFYAGWGRIDLSPPVQTGDTRGTGGLGGARQGKGFGVGVNAPIVFNFFNNFFDRYYGLPAIGIVMTEFYNGAVSGYYGNTVPWQYGTDWANPGAIPPTTLNAGDV
jgi:hypothetical protein